MGIEFVLGQFEIKDILNEKIENVEKYIKADEEYLKELLEDDDADKFMISVQQHEIRKSRGRVRSLKLYADKVAMGLHKFTLDEIKALETL